MTPESVRTRNKRIGLAAAGVFVIFDRSFVDGRVCICYDRGCRWRHVQHDFALAFGLEPHLRYNRYERTTLLASSAILSESIFTDDASSFRYPKRSPP